MPWSADLVNFARGGSGHGDFGIDVVRTLPCAFTRLLGRTGKRRIQTVEMPVQIAEIAVDHVAAPHGRLVTLETEDDVVFGVLQLQRIQRQIIPSARSESVIRYEESRSRGAYFALDGGAPFSSYSPSSPVMTSSKYSRIDR